MSPARGFKETMGKYRDKTSCKHKSEIINYKPNEAYKDRHLRRLNKNKEHLDLFRKWCKTAKAKFKLFNNGEHWKVEYNENTFDWWPRSAKLIINQKWKRGVHVHDYTQLIKFIEDY